MAAMASTEEELPPLDPKYNGALSPEACFRAQKLSKAQGGTAHAYGVECYESLICEATRLTALTKRLSKAEQKICNSQTNYFKVHPPRPAPRASATHNHIRAPHPDNS